MYKTPGGGIVSIMFFIGLLAYGLSLFADIWAYKIRAISTYTSFKSRNDNSFNLELGDSDFNFAIGFK